jgi:replicative DNA helicase
MANRGYRKHLRLQGEKRFKEEERARQAEKETRIVDYSRKELEEAGFRVCFFQPEFLEPPSPEMEAANDLLNAEQYYTPSAEDLENARNVFPDDASSFISDEEFLISRRNQEPPEEITQAQLAEARAMITRDMNARDTVKLGLLIQRLETDIYRYETAKKNAETALRENQELTDLLKGKGSREKVQAIIATLQEKSGQLTRLRNHHEQAMKFASVSSSFNRTPPYSEDSERIVLGLTIKYPELRAKHSQPYTNMMFFIPAHREIHSSMMKVAALDRVTLSDQLKHDGKLDVVGGQTTIERLLFEVADLGPGSFDTHWDAIESRYILRTAITQCREIEHEMFEADINNISSIPEWIRQKSTELVEKSVPRRFRVHRDLRALVDETTEDFADLVRREGKPRISTGYLVLDRIMHGVHPGELHIMGADTKAGKTTLMANLADNVALQGYGTAVFTFESFGKQIIQKLVAKRAKFDTEFFRYFEKGQVTETMIAEVFRAAREEVRELPLYIDDATPADLDLLKMRVKQLKIEHPNLALVIIDGMQSFRGYKPYEGTKASIYEEVLKGLRTDIAGQNHVGVLLTSQIKTQEVYLRANMRPYRLNDFPDCAAIPKIADSAFFIYRPEGYILQGKYRNRKQEEYFTTENLERLGLLKRIEVIPAALRVGDRLKKGGWLGCDMPFANIFPLELLAQ